MASTAKLFGFRQGHKVGFKEGRKSMGQMIQHAPNMMPVAFGVMTTDDNPKEESGSPFGDYPFTFPHGD